MLLGPGLSGFRGNLPRPLEWPAGLLTGACLLFFVLLAGLMIILTGQLRGDHFFPIAEQECRAVAAYAKSLPVARVNPVLSEVGDPQIVREGDGILNRLDCTLVFQEAGINTAADCDSEADIMCVPYDVVFSRALPNATKQGFTLTVEYPCSFLCGSGYEVDFMPIKNEWRAVSTRQIWIS